MCDGLCAIWRIERTTPPRQSQEEARGGDETARDETKTNKEES